VANKKRNAASAAAGKKASSATAAPPPAAAAADKPLRVHRRCDECGIRVRDGATIVTDPDDERRAYCTACWYAYENPEEASADAEPAAEPRKHVTPFNK